MMIENFCFLLISILLCTYDGTVTFPRHEWTFLSVFSRISYLANFIIITQYRGLCKRNMPLIFVEGYSGPYNCAQIVLRKGASTK